MSFQSRERLIVPVDIFVSPAEPRQGLPARVARAWARWRERAEMRRALARMDVRSLRDLGISPAAAAYEAARPFWQEPGPLR